MNVQPLAVRVGGERIGEPGRGRRGTSSSSRCRRTPRGCPSRSSSPLPPRFTSSHVFSPDVVDEELRVAGVGSRRRCGTGCAVPAVDLGALRRWWRGDARRRARHRIRLADERVVGGYPTGEGDAQDLSVQQAEVLGRRVACATGIGAAVADRHIQVAVSADVQITTVVIAGRNPPCCRAVELRMPD